MIQQATFDRLLERWLQTPDPEIVGIVRRERVLPIMTTIGATYCLGRDGRVLAWTWETEPELETVEDRSERIWALVSGAEKYPELVALLPAKPATAVECRECGGRGKIHRDKLGCGTCVGLGWVDEPV